MKNLTKRVGAIVLAACMAMSMIASVSAASYKLTLTFTGENAKGVEKTITSTSGSLGESEILAAAVYQMVAAQTTSEQKATHIAHGADGDCGASCGLYQLWSHELDALFDAGEENYDNGASAWTTWVENFTGHDGDVRLVTWLKDLDATVGNTIATNGDATYSMKYTAESGKEYVLTVAVDRRASGGTYVPPSTPSTPSDPTPSDPTPSTPTDTVVEVPEASAPGEVVTLPVEEVKVGEDTTITVNTKSESSVKVEIPVAETTPGTVAVIIKEDGSEQIVRDGIVTENGVQVEVSDGDKIVVKDNSKSFDDVTDAHWGKNAVTFVAARGIFAGTGNNNFSPDVSTTRGMIAQVLHNLEYNEDHPHDGHNFPDVGDHHWYDAAVHWAEDHGIVGGYGDGTFQGEKNVTREELVVMLWNYAGKQASVVGDYVLDFNDAEKVSSWALDAMNWALENGILGGKGGKMLDPTGLATRAELAQMIKNFCENK